MNDDNDELLNRVEEDDTSLTSVGDEQTRRKSGTGLIVRLLFSGILLALLFLSFIFVKSQISGDTKEGEVRAVTTKDQSSNTLPQRTFILPSVEPKVIEEAVIVPDLRVEPIALKEVHTQAEVKGDPAIPVPTLNKSSAKISVIRNANTATSATSTSNDDPNSFGVVAANEPSGGESELSRHLAPTLVAMATAQKFRNRNFILAKGAFINCVLKTRLDSSVPGMSSCIVTRDIYSDNGKVILIEKGSEVTGEYKSKLNRGVSRIFVLWNRIKTPVGVVINIDSPASDSLGASGVPGFLDTHFWQRFGGALLLSLVDDVATAVANSNSDNEGTIVNSGSDNANSGAEIALEESIDIPATLLVNHGSKVGIYVARDLDFSSVYDVR